MTWKNRTFRREWEIRLQEDPLCATSVGRHEYDDRLPSVSAEDEARRAALWRDLLDALEAIDPATLGEQDRINYFHTPKRIATSRGRALAYKMGELKIRALRRRAEEALGARFDLRAFHDVVPGSGSVPLPVLEDLVEAYIQQAQAAS